MLQPFAWSPVLVVDDDQASGLLALKLLLRAGLRNVEALNDARLVVDWVEEHDPDLVLLDLHMPFLDGYAVLAALRERSSSTDLPVIVLTADNTLEASRRALELGANDFLLKPLQPVELTHRVRNLLDMRAAHRSLHRRQRWLEEAERFSRGLFSGEIESPLETVAARAMALADADHVLTMDARPQTALDGGLVTPQRPASSAGSTREATLGFDFSGAIRAKVCHEGSPVLVADALAEPDLSFTGDDRLDVGPMMLLPIPGTESTRGVVGLVRRRGREPYATGDLEAAHQFIAGAAIALELVERRADRKRYLDFFEVLVSQVAEYAIVRLDVDGTIASWNVGAERVEGYTAEEAIGRPFFLFRSEEDVREGVPKRLLREARDTGRAQHEGWGVRKDGTRFWAEVSISALRDDHGMLIGFVKVTRDSTESKRLERARESFFAALSHDLRTPLNSIQGFVEMLPIVDDDRRADFINRVQSNVGRLTVLIDNLLDHALLRAGAVPVNLEVVRPAVVAAAVVRDLSPLLGTHEVVVPDSELAVVADQEALGRVLGNLLVNAARYSPDGTSIAVGFEERAGEGTGRITVTDHGRGIAREDLVTIFDEFERGALAEADGGTGLGLSSVRQLVSLQQGDVSIESEQGVGTTVIVDLPLPSTALRPGAAVPNPRDASAPSDTPGAPPSGGPRAGSSASGYQSVHERPERDDPAVHGPGPAAR